MKMRTEEGYVVGFHGKPAEILEHVRHLVKPFIAPLANRVIDNGRQPSYFLHSRRPELPCAKKGVPYCGGSRYGSW